VKAVEMSSGEVVSLAEWEQIFGGVKIWDELD
jgi:hypothetical protein